MKRCASTNKAQNMKKTQLHHFRPTLPHRPLCIPTLLLLPLLLLQCLNPSPIFVTATITLSSTGKQFHSRPASFGMNLEYGLQYVALLQYVEDDPHLCHGTRDAGAADMNTASGTFDYTNDWRKVGHKDQDEGGHGFVETWKRWIDEKFRGERKPSLVQLPTTSEEGGGYGEATARQDRRQRHLLRSVLPSQLGCKEEDDCQGPLNESLNDKLFLQDDGEVLQEIGGVSEAEGASTIDLGTISAIHSINSETDTINGNMNNKKEQDINVVPSHGVPVALLAKRGQCTYETKARVASTLTSPHGVVRFVIVYDDSMDDGDRLITMMPTSDDDRNKAEGHDLYSDVGMVFVSYESGIDLRQFLNNDVHGMNLRSQGGPRILIDSTDRWFPYSQPTAGLALMLMLFGCVCSLSLFLSTTAIGGGRSGDSIVSGNEHNLFLLGPDGQVLSPEERERRRREARGGGGRRRGNGLRLLTLEEVETLPTMEYSSGESSPSNSSLELRDKSDMPYMDDEEENMQRELNNEGTLNQDDNEDPPRGGLCNDLSEALLPTKSSSPEPTKSEYFNHNTCSICLDEYELGEQIRVLPCQHTFHSDCIFPWLTERSPTCPLCKAMFEAVRYSDGEDEGEGGEDEEVGEGDREREERGRARRAGEEENGAQEDGRDVGDVNIGRSLRNGRNRLRAQRHSQEQAERGQTEEVEAPGGARESSLATEASAEAVEGDHNEEGLWNFMQRRRDRRRRIRAEREEEQEQGQEEDALRASRQQRPRRSASGDVNAADATTDTATANSGGASRFWGLFDGFGAATTNDTTTTVTDDDGVNTTTNGDALHQGGRLDEPLLSNDDRGEMV